MSKLGREARVRRAQKRRRKRLQSFLIIGGAAIAIVAGLIVLSDGSGVNLAQVTDYSALPQGVEADGSPYIGNHDAPVTLVEYSDFSCPSCMMFSKTVHQLIDTHVSDGTLKVIYKPIVFINPQTSPTAATAALCAADQDKFWEMHDVIFDVLSTQGSRAFVASRLSNLAGDLDLNQATFDTCMNTETQQEVIQAVAAEAQAMGINSTPTVVLNNSMLQPGIVPFDVLDTMILELAS